MAAGLNEDGITNYCTWNDKEGEIKGVDVAKSMLEIAQNPGFSNRTDTEFLQGVMDGTVIAGVSGVWNAMAIEEAWEKILALQSCLRLRVQAVRYKWRPFRDVSWLV